VKTKSYQVAIFVDDEPNRIRYILCQNESGRLVRAGWLMNIADTPVIDIYDWLPEDGRMVKIGGMPFVLG
jgi:hypothetical protein